MAKIKIVAKKSSTKKLQQGKPQLNRQVVMEVLLVVKS